MDQQFSSEERLEKIRAILTKRWDHGDESLADSDVREIELLCGAMIFCEPCSLHGGAGRYVYHAPPECATEPVL